MVAALSTLNATIFTGARVYFAMARDITLLPRVGEWDERGRAPANGLIAQGAVALLLVVLGAASRDGFQAMVDYRAPVFCNDTIRVTMEVTAKRETSKPDRGVVTFRHTIRNQSGDVVLEMDKTRMIRRREASAAH